MPLILIVNSQFHKIKAFNSEVQRLNAACISKYFIYQWSRLIRLSFDSILHNLGSITSYIRMMLYVNLIFPLCLPTFAFHLCILHRPRRFVQQTEWFSTISCFYNEIVITKILCVVNDWKTNFSVTYFQNNLYQNSCFITLNLTAGFSQSRWLNTVYRISVYFMP